MRVLLCNHVVNVKGSPVECANGIQYVLDAVLPLHALLAFVYHGGQVLHMGFGRKTTKHLCHPSPTFGNVKPICDAVLKRCISL